MFRSGSVLQDRKKEGKAQIALEFMIVYSFVLVIFMILFVLIVNQRSLTLNQQAYSSLQLVTQNIANYINQALSSGNGYNATVLIPGEIGTAPYTIEISSSGVVIANLTTGKRTTLAYAFSRARSLQINGVPKLSANGVTLYQINNIGQVSIANSKGTIYIDESPVSTLGQVGSTFVNPYSNSKAMEFNGQTSYISLNFPLNGLSPHNICNITILAWSYDSSMPSTGNNGGVIGLWNGSSPSASSGGWDDIEYNDNLLRFELRNGTSGNSWSVSGTFAKKWIMTAMVLANGIVTAGYINNQSYPDGKNIGCISLNSGVIGKWDRYFNGSIANVQVYNSALSSNQVLSAYSEGVGGYPVMPSNVVVWMPLNGNTHDYSVGSNQGTDYNIEGATTVSMISTKSVLSNGGSSNDLLVGTVASSGIFNQSGLQNIALYSNSTGYTMTTLVGGNLSNIGIDSYQFNGNQSTVGNLIGWWPLVASTPNAGNTAYDLSEHYNNGAFYDNGIVSNALWGNYIPTSTNLLSAYFNGSAKIDTGTPLEAQNFTIAMWVNPSNAIKMDSGNGYSLLNTIGSNEIQLWLNNGGGSTAAPGSGVQEMGIGTQYYHGYGIDNNTWSFLAFTVNNGYVSFYANGKGPYTVSGVFAPAYSLNNISLGESAAGVSQYAGYMSNVQVYSKALSNLQVSQLYGEGVSGVPVGDNASLYSWWPLAGNANSYTSNPNNGTPTGIIFTNVNYMNAVSSGTKVANFNGNSGYVDLNNPSDLQFASGASFTLSAWIKVNSCTDGAIFGHGSASYTFYVYPSGSSCYLDFASSSVANIGTGVEIPTNKWIYVNAVNNIGSNVYMYVDGQEYGPYAFTNSYSYSEDLRIGDSQSDSGFFFNGQIADAQIYNEGLTSTQISQLYQEGLPQMVYKNLTFG